MSYKHDASANRDALFGGAGGDSKKKKKSSKSSKEDRDDLFGGKSSSKSSSSSRPKTSLSASSSGSSRPKPSVPSSKGYSYTKKKKSPISIGLTGEAKEAKIKEAEDYRDKAKKAMQKGLFSKPDPLAASTYYKRAADAYQQCGELRLERMYRINSADCQKAVGAFATAAAEYTRAAELVEDADDEELEMKREIGKKLLLNAAECWLQMNEPGKAASSKVQAALALTWGDESSLLPQVALAALEEAVEAHVPDPLNPYSRYRQTGVSAYVNPNSDETAENCSDEAMALAEQHIVTRPFAHESVQEVVYVLISFGEYPSALYAQGAVSTLLDRDGVSSLTLSRSFVAETILTLAMGDPVLAEQQFLNRHVQKTSYLNARECKLAEELFRAVKVRDGEALEEARSIKGSNRAGIGNLHESLREVLTMIRLSGVARKGDPETYASEKKSSSDKKKKSSSSSSKKESKKDPEKPKLSLDELAAKSGYEADVAAADALDSSAVQNELDALDFGDESESDLDDDDIDLR
ncbi:soluble NSF attachment protein, SNAP [Nitzschia inconspicua]|uniref:Soluble NSF attachment protein, SNAP n=1 Tax=Nitzschia inconspicua TaxID=303405 RepID=A0A9K3KNG1_9STRA|nr:soluble NSF attachment protein, SNAP [Nitzschia inconspicua]